jgi:hypothetical protein
MRIATALQATQRQFAGLLRPIATAAFFAAKLTTDRGFVSTQLISNLRDGLIGFGRVVNLMSFNLTEVFVIHRATSTGWSTKMKCSTR